MEYVRLFQLGMATSLTWLIAGFHDWQPASHPHASQVALAVVAFLLAFPRFLLGDSRAAKLTYEALPSASPGVGGVLVSLDFLLMSLHILVFILMADRVHQAAGFLAAYAALMVLNVVWLAWRGLLTAGCLLTASALSKAQRSELLELVRMYFLWITNNALFLLTLKLVHGSCPAWVLTGLLLTLVNSCVDLAAGRKFYGKELGVLKA